MSDYLGDNQTRVLDTRDRNWDEVVYQKKKPPLSSEYNLSGKISSEKDRNSNAVVIPSGWNLVGSVKDGANESACRVADVVTSSGYAANTFKLMALDEGVDARNLLAVVNGWKLLVQGTNSSDENNIITLPDPPVSASVGYRTQFVFLEVWRKLIEPDDVVYRHGNVLYGGTNPDNDLIDPYKNVETSLRVQVQYRIRAVNSDLETYPEGFGNIYAQGPRTSASTCTTDVFEQVPGDPGLWRAGLGDTASQETLETVDGYVYAIPMFGVARRNTLAYDPDDNSNGAGVTVSEYLQGTASDRPDNQCNDWIVSANIVDMRHRVDPQINMREVCADAFKKLIKGESRGVMAKTVLGGEGFGSALTQADSMSDVDKAGSTRIGISDGQRRVFSNASYTQPETIIVKTVADKTIGTPSTDWTTGDRFEIDVSYPTTVYPYGTQISDVAEIFTDSSANLPVTDATQVTSTPDDNVIFEIPGTSTLIGTSTPLRVEYTISYPAGPHGLSLLPDSFLEFRKEDSTANIAPEGMDVRVRGLGPVVTVDSTEFTMLHNAGASIVEKWDFGHQMVYHTVGNGSQTVSVPRTVDGHDILGVATAAIDSTYVNPSAISRTASSYSVNLGTLAPIDHDVELTLYTGAKFFKANAQGRAITDCFSMQELSPIESPNGTKTTFTLDSTDSVILGIASNNNVDGAGIAYVNDVQKILETNNAGLPVDSSKSRIQIEFSLADTPSTGSVIEVPVLTRSAVGASEGYTCFYEATPYQGLTDSTVTGMIEEVGPAIVTSAGSGAITDSTYSTGSATFTADSTIISGSGTAWLANVNVGDEIILDATSTKSYKIETVFNDDTLHVKNPVQDSGSGSYTIAALGTPFYTHPNVIDRLPALLADNDASGVSEELSTALSMSTPLLETRLLARIQDITDLPPNTAWIGVNAAERGRSKVYLPGTPLGEGTLGLSYEKLASTPGYKKTYQAYILNRDNDGRLYLMVVGSETGNSTVWNRFNEVSEDDVVDIFEIPGRPVTIRRVY